MPPLASRISEDLRGVVSGDVLCDDVSRTLYSSDASLYEVAPAAIVRPRVTADVVAVVRYAVENGLSIHPRGAGSGLAGGSIGEGIVVDFSRYMRRLLSDDGQIVRVQPGLVHADLNRRLAPSRRVFGPDPAMTEVTTLGGVAAVDGSGSRRPAYGSARDHVLGLSMVLSDGNVIRLGRTADASPETTDPASPSPAAQRAAEIAASTAELLDLRRDVIREHAPHGCANGSGYALDPLLASHDSRDSGGGTTEPPLDLTPLVVGSEGTLGLITELTLRVVPLPKVIGAALLTFTSLERAALAVQAIAPLGVSACDLMDRRHVSLARELDPRYEVLLSGAAEAVLYVEVFDDTEAGANERLHRVLEAVRGENPLAADALIAERPEELRLFGELSRKFVSYLHGLKGNRRATPGVEDITLPPAALPQFFSRMQDTLKRRQVTASVFGHAAHGQLHVRPLLDVASPADLRKLETLASDLYETVWLLGGSMSGEHGDGLSRTPFTSRQHGPLVNVFREVKRLFDPAGAMNPGKIVPAPGSRMTHNTRRQVAARHSTDEVAVARGSGPPAPPAANTEGAPAAVVELQLKWDIDDATLAARTCNGCGACRSGGAGVRMCPIFRYTPREEASPRAKANLVRAVLTGALPADTLLRDDARQAADLCVHCHQCRIECPAEVDIPRLMVEAKAAHVKTNGLPLDLWWSARLDAVARVLSRWPTVANRAFASQRVRWLLERFGGLAAGRRLPRLTRRPYLRRAHSRKLDRVPPAGGETVLYFVDTFANYFDAEVAEAFERILKRHGVALYVPQQQLHSGMTMIVQGALDAARDVAERNVSLLAEAIRKGHTVVATEPSAVLALTREYPMLLAGDEDALLVAQHTQEACHYLWRRHLDAKLRLDLQPIKLRVAYHQPCHARALGIGAPAESLLRLIPGVELTHVEKGCSGMAGTFGLLKRNYRSSLRAGLPLLAELRSGPYDLGASECGACRTQMEQSAPFATLHPLKLLAASYGVMPEVLHRLPQAKRT